MKFSFSIFFYKPLAKLFTFFLSQEFVKKPKNISENIVIAPKKLDVIVIPVHNIPQSIDIKDKIPSLEADDKMDIDPELNSPISCEIVTYDNIEKLEKEEKIDEYKLNDNIIEISDDEEFEPIEAERIRLLNDLNTYKDSIIRLQSDKHNLRRQNNRLRNKILNDNNFIFSNYLSGSDNPATISRGVSTLDTVAVALSGGNDEVKGKLLDGLNRRNAVLILQ